MTKEIFKKSVATKTLQLSNYKKFKHFEPALFILIVPLVFLFLFLKDYIDGSPKPISQTILLLIIIPTIIAILLYILQRNRLKFKTVKTTLHRTELYQIVIKVAADLEWNIHYQKGNVILADTSPGFLSGSWGEQITILIDGNNVLINSICDLNTKMSLVSMGRNRKNMNTLIREIEKANTL